MNFTIELFLQLYTIFMAVMFGLLILRKIKERGTLDIEILNSGGFYENKKVRPQDDKLAITKNWKANVESAAIFTERKNPLKFWRLPKRKLYFAENQAEPLKFKGNPGKMDSELAKYWDKSEVEKFIKKQVLKARAELKPMSNIQFFILAILVGFNLLLSFLVINRVGF